MEVGCICWGGAGDQKMPLCCWSLEVPMLADEVEGTDVLGRAVGVNIKNR